MASDSIYVSSSDSGSCVTSDAAFPMLSDPGSLTTHTILNPPQRRLTGEHKSLSSETRPRSTPPEPSFLSGENRHTSLESESCLSPKEFSHGPLNKSLLSHAREHSLELLPGTFYPQSRYLAPCPTLAGHQYRPRSLFVPLVRIRHGLFLRAPLDSSPPDWCFSQLLHPTLSPRFRH